jgi:PAS domain S-box-containing protein
MDSLGKDTGIFLTAILNGTNYAIIAMDTKGLIKSFNAGAERMLGYMANELINKHSVLLLHDKTEIRQRTPEEKAAADPFSILVSKACMGEVDEAEYTYVRKDESRIWVHLSTSCIRNPDGTLLGYVVIAKDVTKEREAEELLKEYARDLEKKNSELDQFAYVVSHDLKAPLRGIYSLSTWIEEDLADKITGDTAHNFDLLRKRVTRMENLINGILAYSKAGRSKNEAVFFSIYELIHDVVSVLVTDQNVQVNIIQPMPFIQTEKIKLEQVFSNLISNAIKYNNSPQPAITITATENETAYTFCVADNGPGIDPAYHQKIFIIFQTLQSRDSFENTGVGLAIVKKIVEENGGTVWVDNSTAQGAKFCFTWLK